MMMLLSDNPPDISRRESAGFYIVQFSEDENLNSVYGLRCFL
jgi:hypothetical protein